MALFTSTPKSKKGEEKAALLHFDDMDDELSSGYDSPVYSNDEDQHRRKADNRTLTDTDDCYVSDESDFSDDENDEFQSGDESDDLDDLEDEQQFSPDDTMKVTNMQPLIDNIRYILSMPDMCDVMFLVGPQRIPTYGLKSILGTRSNVFFSLFLKKAQEEMNSKKKSKKQKNTSRHENKTTIIIDSYDVDVFRTFLEFIHCGSVVMDATTVVGLLCCAVEFDISELRIACWEFIDRCLTPSSTLIVMKETVRYCDHVPAQKVRDVLESRKNKAQTSFSSKTRTHPSSLRQGPVGQETVV